MRGTRYGDFSRFAAPGRYQGVLLQQGRVQLDADFNAQAELTQHVLRTALNDLFGGSCAPATAPGFRVRPKLALAFDGDDSLVLDPSFAPRVGEARTLELWLTWDHGECVLLECAGAYLLRLDRHGDLELELLDGQAPLRAGQRLPHGERVRLALVTGRGFIALYLDGRQLTRRATAPMDRIHAPLVFGQRFHGLLSGVRAWGRTQSLAQLAEAQEPQLEDDADLLVAWPAEAGGLGMPATHRGPREVLVDLIIEPGRYYVDGILCELAAPLHYSEIPDSPPLPRRGEHVATLEVWEETVTAVEEPSLREVALGGLDTSVRTRLAFAVRLGEVADTTGLMAAEHRGELVPGNYLYRIEVHNTGSLGSDVEVEVIEIDVDGGELVLAAAWDGPDEFELVAVDDAGAVIVIAHRATEIRHDRVRVAGDLEPVRALRGHRLRRRGGAPEFKWSRRNGAELFALAPGLQVLPSPTIEPLAVDDLVEALPEAQPLQRVRGVGDDGLELDGTVSGDYLRRWDGAFSGHTGWTELEDGIRVRFSAGDYRRGDYWWVVARQDERSIEWPQQSGHPAWLAPSGVERVTAPLALIDVGHEGVSVRDLRRIVPEAVEVEPVPSPPPVVVHPRPAPEPPAPDDDSVDIIEEEEREYELAWQRIASLDEVTDRIHGAVSAWGAIVIHTAQELFSVAGEVERVASLPARREGAATCVVDDLLLLIGGGRDADHADHLVFAFDFEAGEWSERAKVPDRVRHASAAVHGGHVHLIGGEHHALLHHGASRAHHIYDPARNRWEKAARVPTRRHGASAEALGDHVHVVGGEHGEHEVYDRRTGHWRREQALPSARQVLSGTAHHGRHVVLVDDVDQREPQSVLAFDPGPGVWTGLPPLPERLEHPHVVSHAGHLHVAGHEADGGAALYRLGSR